MYSALLSYQSGAATSAIHGFSAPGAANNVISLSRNATKRTAKTRKSGRHSPVSFAARCVADVASAVRLAARVAVLGVCGVVANAAKKNIPSHQKQVT